MSNRQVSEIDKAYREGDMMALQALLGWPEDFPNCLQPYHLAIGDYPLEYAIYWSPLSFIVELIKIGANPNYPSQDGFPCLLAVLSTSRSDKYELLKLLLDKGADIEQRGHNDWTPLHYAVNMCDLEAIIILMEYGADPHAKTRMDDCTSPLEDAETNELKETLEMMSRDIERT